MSNFENKTELQINLTKPIDNSNKSIGLVNHSANVTLYNDVYDDAKILELYTNESIIDWEFNNNITEEHVIAGGDRWYGRGVIEEAENGNWIMIVRNSSDHVGSDTVWDFYCSDDEGRTWSESNTYCDGSGMGSAPLGNLTDDNRYMDAYIQKMNDGTLIFTVAPDYDHSKISYSYDNGSTWSDLEFTNWTDTGNWTEDELILGFDGVNVGNYSFQTAWLDEGNDYAGLAVTKDNGKTWEYVTDIIGPDSGLSAIETGIAHIGDTESDYDFITISRDRDGTKTYRRYIYDAFSDNPIKSSIDDISDIVGRLVKIMIHEPYEDYLFVASGVDYDDSINDRPGKFLITDELFSKIYVDEDIVPGEGDSGYSDVRARSDIEEKVYFTGYYEEGSGTNPENQLGYTFDLNHTRWTAVKNTTTVVNNSINTIEYNWTETGKYKWNIKLTESDGEETFNENNYTLSLFEHLLNNPQNLQNKDITTDSFNSTWDSVENAEEYEVELHSNSDYSNLIDNATITETFNVFYGLSDDTTYYWRVKAIAENYTDSNWAESSVTIDEEEEEYSSSSSGGGEPPFWEGTYVLNDKQIKEEFNSEKGFTRALEVKNRMRVVVNDNEHHVGVANISEEDETAIVNVSSEPQQAEMSVGDIEKFDATNDSYYDISVELIGIEDSKANLTVKSIHEEMPEEPVEATDEGDEQTEETDEEEPETEEKSYWYFWVLGILAFIVIVGLIVYNLMRKNKK